MKVRSVCVYTLALFLISCSQEEPASPGLPASQGSLSMHVRENGRNLSGLADLRHESRPEVNAFDPSEAGLNFEHVLGVNSSPLNLFTPRSGPFVATGDGVSYTLSRSRDDSPRQVSARLTYRIVPPHYVDFEFVATVHDASQFERGIVGFFFASYMSQVDSNEIEFWGVPFEGAAPQWVTSSRSTTPGQVGESYVSITDPGLSYDESDPDLRMSFVGPDYPRHAMPFYFGRVSGMVYAIMFSDPDVRFTVMRWQASRGRPAWDFNHVVRGVESGDTVALSGRVVWKPFVGADDVMQEYLNWKDRRP